MLDKAIKYGKEHRKPYRGAKKVDRGCRNHGDCPYCESNRLFKSNLGKGKLAVIDTELEYWDLFYSYDEGMY